MSDISKPTSFKYDEFDVYLAKDVYDYDPVFFKGSNC